MRFLLMLIVVLACGINVFAQIDFAAGGSGPTTMPSQSYNETRCADVTVLSSSIHVTSATLKRFAAPSPKALVGLRVYSSVTKALLYKKDTIVSSMHDGAVTIPASFVLDKGVSYRIGFYCHDHPDTTWSCSGYFLLPTLPYVESSNHLRINDIYQSNDDAFPENTNLYIPFISLDYDPVGIDEISIHPAASIYPNPFTTQTTIHVGRILNNATLTVYNPLGQVVKQINDIAGESTILNRDNLPAGIYYARMQQGNETILSEKIIVQN